MSKIEVKTETREMLFQGHSRITDSARAYEKLLMSYVVKCVTAMETEENEKIDNALIEACVLAENAIHAKVNLLAFTMDLELALLETYIQDLLGRNVDNIETVRVGFQTRDTIFVTIDTKDNFNIGLLVKVSKVYRIKTIHGYINRNTDDYIGVMKELYNIDKPIIKDNWWSKDMKKIS
nr:MAG TPA: hypothetical protein [Caudoviricetes sp.]